MPLFDQQVSRQKKLKISYCASKSIYKKKPIGHDHGMYCLNVSGHDL
jgi:hypothetical protein